MTSDHVKEACKPERGEGGGSKKAMSLPERRGKRLRNAVGEEFLKSKLLVCLVKLCLTIQIIYDLFYVFERYLLVIVSLILHLTVG